MLLNRVPTVTDILHAMGIAQTSPNFSQNLDKYTVCTCIYVQYKLKRGISVDCFALRDIFIKHRLLIRLLVCASVGKINALNNCVTTKTSFWSV